MQPRVHWQTNSEVQYSTYVKWLLLNLNKQIQAYTIKWILKSLHSLKHTIHKERRPI